MKNIKIGVRLSIIMVVAIISTVIIAISAIVNLNRVYGYVSWVSDYNVHQLSMLVEMFHNFDTLRRHLRDAVIATDADTIQIYLDSVFTRYGELVEMTESYIAHLEKMGTTYGEEFETVVAFKQALPYAAEIVINISQYAVANDAERALYYLQNQCVPFTQAMNDQLEHLSYLNNRQAERTAAEAHETLTLTFITMGITTAVSVIILLILITVVTKSIVKPLRRMVDVSNNIANGNLNVNLDTTAKDETGDLARKLSKVVSTVNNIIGDISEMYVNHEIEGKTSYKIDSQKFSGAYKEVADGVNKMAESYIIMCDEILGTMEEIAKGNLNISLPQYRGEKAVVNSTAKKVILSIQEVASDIDTIVQAGANGDLSTQTNNEHLGEWARIILSINKLMESFGTVMDDTNQALEHLANGDFSYRITTQYKGEYDQMKQSTNITCQSIESYISEVSNVLEYMANGDLTHDITQDYTGDFTSIKESINKISSNLNITMKEIAAASEQVHAGSSQIAIASSKIANDALDQTHAIEDLKENIMEIIRRTNESNDSAANATTLTNASMKNAEAGNKEMASLLEAMSGIADSSTKISNINKTIEDIAFQTNLLALNAAVEASRAGEHGKGFAVVSEEVRSLAEKSRLAAQETTSLIQESIERVQEGTKQVNDTAESFNQIAKNVADIVDVVSKIQEASEKQSEAIISMNDGIDKISQTVHSNSASSHESAASSEELNSQSHTLKQKIEFFKTR